MYSKQHNKSNDRLPKITVLRLYGPKFCLAPLAIFCDNVDTQNTEKGNVNFMIDVVALGELLIDFATISADGEGYPTMAAHPGGAPANFLAALAKFGASTALLGKVGADAFGRLLTDTLQRAGIGTPGSGPP